MVLARSDEEINQVLDWAAEGEDQGSHYPGMSYEEGVRAALDWVLGINETRPDE